MSASEPTLKCVIAWSDRRNLCSIVGDALQAKIDAGGVLRLSEDALIIHIANDPAEIRDWVRSALEDGESVFVVEFERWSGYGDGVDSNWLMRRGH
jgi:hypothetical protein